MTAYYPLQPPSGFHNSYYPYYPPPPAPPLGAAAAGPPPLLPHQVHLPQQYQPQPPFAHHATAAPQPLQDEFRTLYIAGLPEDVKPHEIYNLFREFPGYQSNHLISGALPKIHRVIHQHLMFYKILSHAQRFLSLIWGQRVQSRT